MAADWSQLPPELLHLISERLDSELYLLRFRSVCSTWRSSIPNPHNHNHHHNFPCNFPLLSNCTIHSNSNSNSNNNASTFSLSKRTLFLLKPPPNQHNQTLNPWLIKFGPDSHGRNHLWNPLSRDSPLPPYFPHVLDFNHLQVFDLGHEVVLDNHNNESLYMEKVVVVDAAAGDTWQIGKGKVRRSVFLTIHVSGKLAVFCCGDDRWTIIPDMPTPYDDVCVFNGKPIAVDGTGRTVRVRPDLGLDLVADSVFGGDKKFLVESDGELLLVDKYLSCVCYCSFLDGDDDDEDNGGGGGSDGEFYGVGWERAVRFDVFRLDEEEKKWVELTSLGDRVLFLGDDCSFSASASDLGFGNGNCVIFRDDAFNTMEFGMGVFHLDQRKISPLRDYPSYFNLFWPPQWVRLH